MADSPCSITPKQWDVLLLIASTFIPRLDEDEIGGVRKWASEYIVSPRWPQIETFLKESAGDCVAFRGYLAKLIDGMPPGQRGRIVSLLDILGGDKGRLLLRYFTGTSTPFETLSRKEREAVFVSWDAAYLSFFRKLHRSLFVLFALAYLRTSEAAIAAMEYPREDPHKDDPLRFGEKTFHRFQFEEFGEATDAELEADVVVVGSGSGGGVVAARLAGELGGLRVVVLEKGDYFHQDDLPLDEIRAGTMLEGGGIGFLRTPDENGVFFAGNTWGGGTAVNWSVSFQLQAMVRTEWATQYGLDFVNTSEFQDCMDRVCQRMGVSTEHNKHNEVNKIVEEGARRLGYNHRLAPRNTGGTEHSCGYCCYGCRYGEKQGCNVTWLVDAQKAGARFVKRCEVDQILLEGSHAVGVRAMVNKTTSLTVRSKRVVVCAGALHTPCLLRNSGIRNPEIGRNLKTHPTISCMAYFKSRETRPWEGAIITTCVTEDENLDGDGYGVKLMPSFLHPGFAYFTIPWKNAMHWKQRIVSYKQAVCIGVVGRDKDSAGTVYPDPVTHKPSIKYSLSRNDGDNLAKGMVSACKVLVAAGADEVQSLHPEGTESYVVDKTNPQCGGGTSDPRFKAFTDSILKTGIGTRYVSGHQVGTCRMGKSPKTSVTDPHGRVHGYSGLYVADGSLFPSGSGTNPMVPIMAMAGWVSDKMMEELKEERSC